MTLIDRQTFASACETTGTCEMHENYQFGPSMDQICIAFTCSGWREAMQFFVNLAHVDSLLATNMVDIVRMDNLGHDWIYYFPGYDLEEIDEDVDEPQPRDRPNPNEDENRSRGISAL